MRSLAVRAVALAAACALIGPPSAASAESVRSPGDAVRSTAVAAAPASRLSASRSATVKVSDSTVGAATSTAQGFLGIATELNTIPTLAGPASDPDTPFIHLLKSLSVGAPMLLRLGGNSTDDSWWEIPGVKKPPYLYTLTPRWGEDVQALLTALGGKAILGVNLLSNSQQIARAEVAAYDQYIGANLIESFELGNEPEFFPIAVPKGPGLHVRYRIAHYDRQFSAMAAALGGVPLAGPGSGSANWLPRLGTVLNDMPASLKLVTVHAYPMKDCSRLTHLSVSQFFAPTSIQGLATSVHAMVKAAAAHGKPLRVDEINGVSCGGEAGVSNSFAEALWGLNVLPALWQAGVQGVNIQTIDGDLNQMITARHSAAGWRVSVQPEYYGLLAFAEVAPAGSRLLKISNPGLSDFYQYAVHSPDKSEHVVLTNVGAAARTVSIAATGTRGSATVSLLRAASLTATGGTTLAGQRLSARTGQLAGTPDLTRIRPGRSGGFSVTVPAHAAAIVALPS